MDKLTLILIPLLPLAVFVALGLRGRKFPGQIGGMIATTAIFVSFILSLITAWQYFFVSGKAAGQYLPQVAVNYEWLRFTDSLSINMGFILDPISVMMLVVVTLVSFMVHTFSLGYMKGEERGATYYAFLSLFTFSMLGLVVATNIFQTYIFWELVGLSSYLLIGFYYNKASAVAASKKAFIVTRFADLGFLIGILILSYYAGTLDYNLMTERFTDHSSREVQAASAAGLLGASALTWGLVLVFVGGAGKSAMFPLHIWLPDAMEGPTPVSALIHAATMVVAGVYLVARLFPVFALSCPIALDVVAWTGIVSALFAAIIACTQTDIKRILAYSTMSQIGYMMFALGISGYYAEEGLGYTASMFHLFTHALFKALLFLCAGVIIHGVHSNELKDMGGLRKRFPLTHVAFLLACLAIAGVPPFAGFFSKEEILTAAFSMNRTIFWIALFTAGITAFYMFRLFFSVFYRKESVQGPRDHAEHSFSMMLPLVLLALGTVTAGFIPFGKFVTADGIEHVLHIDWNFSLIPIGFSVAGILLAAALYLSPKNTAEKISSRAGIIYTAAHRKFYVDEVWTFFTKKIIFNLVGRPAAWIDRNIVDGLMNLTGKVTQLFSISISGVQSGKVQLYAVYFLLGSLGLIFLTVYYLLNA